MNLSISGTNITGNLSLDAVCHSNARLPGAEFNLKGNVEGQWEGKGAISGTWTGTVRWCGNDEQRSGSFSVSLSGGKVYFSATGSYYNRYVFTALGKVASGGSSGGDSADASSPPSSWKRPTVTPGASSYSSLGPPAPGFRSGIPPNLRESVFGTVEMNLNETRMFVMPQAGSWFRTEDMKQIESFTNCYEASYYAEPGSMLRDEGKVGEGANVKAVGEGIGKVYGSKGCNCIYVGGEQSHCTLRGVWLVVVGEKGYEEYTGKKRSESADSGPTPDIERVTVKGRTVLRGLKKPVGNAQISLLSSQGGTYYRDAWKSGSNGRFSIRAGNMLLSGVYEVMAQKRYSDDMGTRADPFTVYKDLWPIKRYFVTITKETAQRGSIDVGDIELDTVDNIFNKGSGRDTSENRGSPTKDTASGKQGKDGRQPPGGYDPTSDPNFKNPGSKPTHIASADKLGGKFQEGQGKSKGSEASQQAPASQPESYTGAGEKQDDSGKKTSYPIGYPSYDYPRDEVTGAGGYYPGNPNWGKGGQYGESTSRSGTASTSSSGSTPGSGSGSSSGAIQSVTAELQNKAGDNVHIFVEGQDNFGPQNKLGPGQKRTISLNVSPQGGTVKFVSGRNGQILARCSWTFNPNASRSTALVTFSDSSSLTCATK
ncbi:MAG: hypothetical protein M1497_08720 [Nitrospirae bacterium]|nr:hypothetical protein [Nitrospirota bacterium]